MSGDGVADAAGAENRCSERPRHLLNKYSHDVDSELRTHRSADDNGLSPETGKTGTFTADGDYEGAGRALGFLRLVHWLG